MASAGPLIRTAPGFTLSQRIIAMIHVQSAEVETGADRLLESLLLSKKLLNEVMQLRKINGNVIRERGIEAGERSNPIPFFA